MQLGKFTFSKTAALAPMAGVADAAFRRLCVGYGAAFTVSEMVSAKALTFGDAKSRELMQLCDRERPAAIQLFGDDPETMAKAARLAMAEQPDWLDINMGCPAPKIAGNHCGSSLMREPELCRRIVKAVCEAVPVPVTVKIRKGYSKTEVNAVEVALACESGGAAAITVHGRTRDQMYAPPVDWDCIRQVKQAVSVPVIGNGDVTTPEQAAALYEQTGCDLIMIGRGALGSPWIFESVNAFLQDGILLPEPTVEQRMDVLCRQIEWAAALKGERVALLEARKHASWYMRNLRGAAVFRGEAGTLCTLADLRNLCYRVIKAQQE